ncbi:MAG TPA: response regulator transcription factor [Candidatus Acidoferrales bacterium]|nr:response regulator transcription factor [Candidatus Acidoferrales bacterium]
MTPVRILLADDHDLIRRGVKALLEAHPGWEVCGEANTGWEAVRKAEQLRPNIAIVDITMPELNGLEAARRIRKASSRTEVLIFSMHYSDQLIRDVLDAGARGYVVKSDAAHDLIGAVEALSNHKPFFTPRATELILNNVGHRPDENGAVGPESSADRPTAREREIIQLLSEGKTTKEAAAALGISVKTAETHRANVMRKLQVHSVTGLVLYAVRNRIIEA